MIASTTKNKINREHIFVKVKHMVVLQNIHTIIWHGKHGALKPHAPNSNKHYIFPHIRQSSTAYQAIIMFNSREPLM